MTNPLLLLSVALLLWIGSSTLVQEDYHIGERYRGKEIDYNYFSSPYKRIEGDFTIAESEVVLYKVQKKEYVCMIYPYQNISREWESV